MDAEADDTDRGEEEEARRHDAPEQMIEDQHEELGNDAYAELALAMRATAHAIGQLRDSDIPARRGDEVEQDLEAAAIQAPDHLLEELAPYHEKAAHRVAELLCQQAAHQAGKAAHPDPAGGELAGARAVHIAAGDDDIRVAFSQCVEQRGQ